MFIKTKTDAGNEINVNTAQICWIDENKVTMSNGLTINVAEESIKDIELFIAPKGKNTKAKNIDVESLMFFQQLHELTGGKGKVIFSLQREKKLKDLLTKHRMTKEQLLRAARNIGNDDFLQGDNENKKRYGDVDYLLRPDKAAKWAEEQEKKKKGMF